MEIDQLIAVMGAVEQDHRLVLKKVKALKEALGCLSGIEKEPTPVLEKLQELKRFLENRFGRPTKKEEVLFSFLKQNLAEKPDVVESLRHEYGEINRKREEFGDCLDLAQGLGNGLTRAVLLDVLAFGFELWDLLDLHVYHETKAVQECFSRFLQAVPGM